MEQLSFDKEDSGLWYVDLPTWTGGKGELLMVSGADTLLDIIANGKNRVTVNVSLKPFKGASKLTLVRKGDEEGGGHYMIEYLGEKKLDLPLWLCDVTNFVFGYIPKEIYIQPQ